jgi:hypothetical protein
MRSEWKAHADPTRIDCGPCSAFFGRFFLAALLCKFGEPFLGCCHVLQYFFG